MTPKEIYELSGEINDRLNDYRNDMASAIIVLMNEHVVNEIDIRKMREDCKKMGLPDVAKRLEDIANVHIVDIYNYNNGETLECYIDRVIIRDLGFVECVFSDVKDPGFEIADSVRFLDIYTIMSVMECVAEYFDAIGEMASKQ